MSLRRLLLTEVMGVVALDLSRVPRVFRRRPICTLIRKEASRGAGN